MVGAMGFPPNSYGPAKRPMDCLVACEHKKPRKYVSVTKLFGDGADAALVRLIGRRARLRRPTTSSRRYFSYYVPRLKSISRKSTIVEVNEVHRPHRSVTDLNPQQLSSDLRRTQRGAPNSAYIVYSVYTVRPVGSSGAFRDADFVDADVEEDDARKTARVNPIRSRRVEVRRFCAQHLRLHQRLLLPSSLLVSLSGLAVPETM